MNQAKERALAASDEASLLAALTELVAVPSLNGTPEESLAQAFAASIIARYGLEVETWELDLPILYAHLACSWEAPHERALGVTGAVGGASDERHLILNGHVDVVQAGDPEK